VLLARVVDVAVLLVLSVLLLRVVFFGREELRCLLVECLNGLSFVRRWLERLPQEVASSGTVASQLVLRLLLLGCLGVALGVLGEEVELALGVIGMLARGVRTVLG